MDKAIWWAPRADLPTPRCFLASIGASAKSVGRHDAGQDRFVGRGALDRREGVGICVGAAGDPCDGPVDAGPGGGELAGFQQHAGVGVEDCVDVVASVGVDAHNKWVGMRDDRCDGHGTFPLVMDMLLLAVTRAR